LMPTRLAHCSTCCTLPALAVSEHALASR